jgi:hypothetical protein
MKSQRSVRFEGVWAHLPLPLRPCDAVDLEGVDFEGVRSGSGNSFGWPRVDTMMNGTLLLISVMV